MPASRMLRFIPVLVVPLCAFLPAVSAQAHQVAAIPAVHSVPASASRPTAAYVWSESTGYYTYNSARKPITVTALPVPGEYEVLIHGLGSIGGDAIAAVTAYDTSGTCEVGSWSASGRNLEVLVDCHDDDGNPAASMFDLVVTRPAAPPHGVFDYSFVYDSTASRTLRSYQYNSAHKKNTVKFLGTGQYRVTLGGPRSSGTRGTVQLSMVGETGGECDLVGWHGARSGQVVDVDCFNGNGVLVDSKFTLIYASASNLLGLNGVATGNAFADRDGAASYRPKIQYDSEKHASVTVKNLGPGQYEVLFSHSEGNPANGGDVQVSAVGENAQECNVELWEQGKTPAVIVDCAAESDGATLYNVEFVVNWVVA